MINSFADRFIITHNKVTETPFVAQDIGERKVIRAGRHAVQIIERAHRVQRRPHINAGLELRQIKIVQGEFRNFRGVIIATALGGAMAPT